MPKSLVQAIDDYRFGERVPSRAEAIRRMIELELRAAKIPNSDSTPDCSRHTLPLEAGGVEFIAENAGGTA